MNIKIEGIFLSPIASGDMVAQETATLLEGIGIKGDRYANRAGTYSVLGKEPGRQLTMISSCGVQDAFGKAGLEWDDASKSMGDLRRNIVLEGISSQELLQCVGSVIQLGDGGARIFVHRNCVPCIYNERKNEIKGFVEALWDAGGVCCEVLEGGTIAIGDTVTIIDSSTNNDQGKLVADDGGKPSWFYIRPSQRTATMVKEALEGKKRSYERLIVSDPEGVRRVQASYESVGLSFWPATTKS